MKENTKKLYSLAELLQTAGPLLVVVGAVVYEIVGEQGACGWILSIGGLLGALGILLKRGDDNSNKRLRRLDRMAFLGHLMYLVSGGFMIQGSRAWLALFAVATVFYIYSVFVKDRVLKKSK